MDHDEIKPQPSTRCAPDVTPRPSRTTLTSSWRRESFQTPHLAMAQSSEKPQADSAPFFDFKLDPALYKRKLWETIFYLVGAGYCSALAALTLVVAWDRDVVLLDNIRAYSVSLNTVLTVYGYLVRIAGLVLVAAVVCFEHAALSDKATTTGIRLEDVRTGDIVSSEQPAEAVKLFVRDRRILPIIAVLVLWGQSAASKYTFVIGTRTTSDVPRMTLVDNRGCGAGPCRASPNYLAVNATGSILPDTRNDSFASMFVGKEADGNARFMHPIPWELFNNPPDGAANYTIVNAGVLRTSSVCTFFNNNASCPSANPAGYITNLDNSTYSTWRGTELMATLAADGNCAVCNASTWSGTADVSWTGGVGNWEATVTNWQNATASVEGLFTTAAWTFLAPFWLANLDGKINATQSADVMPQLENAMSLFSISSAAWSTAVTPRGLTDQPVSRTVTVAAIQGDRAPATIQACLLFFMALVCILGVRSSLRRKLALTTTQCVAAGAGLQVTREALQSDSDGWKPSKQKFVLVAPTPADKEMGDTVHLVPVS